MTAINTVYLIDSSIYVFRGWFTLPDSFQDRDGRPVNAVYGFADFLFKLLSTEQPYYLVCAFDISLTSSFRNEIYPAYKANRESAPPELKYQFEMCRELVRALGIREVASNRYEADDLIGTLAHNAKLQGFHNIIVSADKDLMQLLGVDDYWWDFAKDIRMNARQVENKFGVRPEQFADLLALTGDKVDNIPGVPGIGIKTAACLLKKWRDLENLFAHLDAVSAMKFRGAARVQQLLISYRESIQMARRLTGIAYDAELPQNIEFMQRTAIDHQALQALCERLNFSLQKWQRLYPQLFVSNLLN